MANADKPFGLRPLGNLAASGSQKQYGCEIVTGKPKGLSAFAMIIVLK